jgi:hypothetical protein
MINLNENKQYLYSNGTILQHNDNVFESYPQEQPVSNNHTISFIWLSYAKMQNFS